MIPWNTTAVPAPSSSTSSSRWGSLVGRVRASAWTAIAARVAGIVVALLVLGWIGRTAAAGPTSPLTLAATGGDASTPLLFTSPASLDAGALVVGVPAPTADPPAAPAPSGPRARASATEPVYLNRASVDELRRLPGVGPKRAEAILVLRQRLGRFQRVEDLLRVKGVGRGAIKKWRPLVRLDAPDAGGV